MSPDLPGRTALVTGAGNGLGRCIALVLAEYGARVVLLGRDDAKLRAVSEPVRRDGGASRALVCDVAEPASVDAAAHALVDRDLDTDQQCRYCRTGRPAGRRRAAFGERFSAPAALDTLTRQGRLGGQERRRVPRPHAARGSADAGATGRLLLETARRDRQSVHDTVGEGAR